MAKSIMIQGTMSNVGKSIIAGGLCRVFVQDGYKVAPFKSQNMALNSFITEEGLEMGRAQVMQAEAAKIQPKVSMNPILLKPTSDKGSQVIVNGEVRGVMSARDYFAMKRELIPEVLQAYQTLDKKYDMIVIEGAGSPAEINLKAEDIVNMGLAKLVKAPVLLVGDIDRGGVFAQIVGTIVLLEEEEKRLIKGSIINKFRGDKEILKPGLTMLEEKSKIPVQGVMPYFYLDIDDEDSLTERFTKKEKKGILDIVVIRLPRISNFTDFNPLEYVEEVSLRYVHHAQEFGNPDMVILPGTKNTIADLLWMRQNGLEAKILQHAEKGKLVLGVCGGYQMLGEEIKDPHEVEGKGDVIGMKLLPLTTVFETEKRRTRITGTVKETRGMLGTMQGAFVEGYEIHMGKTMQMKSVKEGRAFLKIKENNKEEWLEDGYAKGNIYGSYIHGLFDSKEITEGIIKVLLVQKGYEGKEIQALDINAYKETQYDKLAELIRENLNMEEIYKIVEEGISYGI